MSLPFDRRRRADLVFTRVGLYVFVDGCFWHGCPEHFTLPKTRTDFWLAKIEGNRARDRDTDRRLLRAGFTLLRVWEHTDPDTASAVVIATYRGLESRDQEALGSARVTDRVARPRSAVTGSLGARGAAPTPDS